MSKPLKPQPTRLALAMPDEERNEYLVTRRTCRLATVASDFTPHISPLWFVWDGDDAWIYSIVNSQRWVNVSSNPKVALVVDDGDGYEELRGVEITGSMAPVGEIPRTGAPDETLDIPERLFADKYSGHVIAHDGRHAWLRLVPDKIVSWDFTKLAALR